MCPKLRCGEGMFRAGQLITIDIVQGVFLAPNGAIAFCLTVRQVYALLHHRTAGGWFSVKVSGLGRGSI